MINWEPQKIRLIHEDKNDGLDICVGLIFKLLHWAARGPAQQACQPLPFVETHIDTLVTEG